MDSELKADLQLTLRGLGRGAADRAAVDLVAQRGDLGLVRGRANLAQAIGNRLLTRQGELAGLGHPAYGSRLYLLIGEPHNRRTQLLAEFYIRESLADEPRIAEVLAVSVAPPDRRAGRSTLAIRLAVLPIDDAAPLAVELALPLEG